MGLNEQLLMKEIDETIRKCRKCGAEIPRGLKIWICDKCRHKKEYAQHYVSYEKKRQKKTDKKGKCRLCKKSFTLKIWQHSSLHWCPTCQNLDIYKNFRTYESLNHTEVFNIPERMD